MLISPTSLATKSKFQKNICFKTRAVGLSNIKTKEFKSGRHLWKWSIGSYEIIVYALNQNYSVLHSCNKIFSYSHLHHIWQTVHCNQYNILVSTGRCWSCDLPSASFQLTFCNGNWNIVLSCSHSSADDTGETNVINSMLLFCFVFTTPIIQRWSPSLVTC